MFNSEDQQQFKNKGISEDKVLWQINQFKTGIKPIHLAKHASINDGILRIENKKEFIDAFEKGNCLITKFVPASGAASRMFKSLFQALTDLNNGKTENDILQSNNDVLEFYENIQKFAFYDELKEKLETMQLNFSLQNILEILLLDNGMGYGKLPKGLLSFHKYDNEVRTPFEEHLLEGALYGKDENNITRLHFTVSPEHKSRFLEILHKKKTGFEERFNVSFEVAFSEQSSSTDTISVTSDNKPFRNENDSILFRPGGHGALIENLNTIDSDIIFIKNIDNVVPEHFVEDTIDYKKVIAGVLIGLQEEIFKFQKQIVAAYSEELQSEIIKFYHEKLFVDLGELVAKSVNNEEFISDLLFRPLRVCGVVKNVGEPGGGPLWVKGENSELSLQIVESSQVDGDSKEQLQIFNNSTHFNPVDIVCGVKNYKGEKYDLRKFVDKNTCFISKKSKDGKELKALELPGLWNGAMANWNTLFVEVPISTFNPVKTVNDLLRKYHQ